MTITLATLQSEPTKPNIDRIITYLHQPVWARRFITGLVPSNDVDAGGDDLIFTAGVASDLSDDSLMELDSSMTKLMDTAWAEGTGQGALDTGAVANTTYHAYLIRNPKSKKVDILSSLSTSAPTMPLGYSQKRRIFSFVRAGGANQVFTAIEIEGGGLEVLISSPTAVTIKSWAGGADDNAAAYTFADAPSGLAFHLKFNATFSDATPAAASGLRFSSLDQADVASGSGTQSLSVGAQGATVPGRNSGSFIIRSEGSGSFRSIRYRANGSTTDHNLVGSFEGWIDRRVS